MKAKLLKIGVALGRFIGSIGIGFKEWIEYQEWKYYTLDQRQTIDLPDNKMVSVHYNRKGEYIKVLFFQWVTDENGERDLQYLRDTIEITLDETKKRTTP